VTQASFWDEDTLGVLYRPGHTFAKIAGTLRGFRRRAEILRHVSRFDVVYIHLEAAPIGPPLVEAALFALGKHVIYDIGDAIFIPKTSPVNRLAAPFRRRSKVAWIARRAREVTAINAYVRDWALDHTPYVTLLPTTIDETYHRRRTPPVRRSRPVVGWTGTHSTLPFLELVRPALRKLARDHDFVFRVICDTAPDFSELPGFEFVRWNKESEIEDLEVLDVGLMPMSDEEFSKGKGGFKAIQYGALEIPCVVSDVGSGREVVVDGRTGFVVPNEVDAWVDRIGRLLRDAELRQSMGRAARPHVLATYSVAAQTPKFLALFNA
jgi:glycosyltransferase involved in cell wall biosynthesis